jgi:hypothetical protein
MGRSAFRDFRAEERRAREADRRASIRLRMAIGRELDDRDITTPAAVAAALLRVQVPDPEHPPTDAERQTWERPLSRVL